MGMWDRIGCREINVGNGIDGTALRTGIDSMGLNGLLLTQRVIETYTIETGPLAHQVCTDQFIIYTNPKLIPLFYYFHILVNILQTPPLPQTRGAIYNGQVTCLPEQLWEWREIRESGGSPCRLHRGNMYILMDIVWGQEWAWASSIVKEQHYKLCHCAAHSIFGYYVERNDRVIWQLNCSLLCKAMIKFGKCYI